MNLVQICFGCVLNDRTHPEAFQKHLNNLKLTFWGRKCAHDSFCKIWQKYVERRSRIVWSCMCDSVWLRTFIFPWKTFCIGLELVETCSLTLGNSFTYPQNVCGASRSLQNDIFSELQSGLQAYKMRMKAYKDSHAYFRVYFLTFMTMFKLAQKRRF